MLDREVLCSLGETMAARSEELAKKFTRLRGKFQHPFAETAFRGIV